MAVFFILIEENPIFFENSNTLLKFVDKLLQSMESIYCIYTDKEISLEKTNFEHIIPLALGGCNEFCLRVEKKKNSILGAHIDGKLSNDYLISSLRRHKKLRGHSGKIPETKLTKSKFKDTNRPVQVIFRDSRTIFFDPVEGRELTENEAQGQTISSTMKFDKNIRMLFTAKVLLSAGYFTYGQIFKDYADHDALRKLMNYGITETDESIKDLEIRIIDPFHEIPDEDKGIHGVFEMICKAIDSPCVIFLLCTENIIGFVGIAGQHIGTLNFKAKTEFFPNDDEYRLGHVLGIQDKRLKRSSFYQMVELLNKEIQSNKKS